MYEKETTLIVDDDNSMCRSLSLIFGEKGYETDTAMTGREAIEKAQERLFNVALLDINLPDMGGVELLSVLKEMHPDMAAIMITGYASLENAIQALNQGASAYITKPLNMDEVLAKVGETLEKQHLVMENRRLLEAAQRELTERKRAEEALRRSEREKATILDSISESVIYQDAEMKILWTNRTAAESVGLALEQLAGRHCYEVWQQRSEVCVGCPVKKTLETGKPQQAETTTPDARMWLVRGYPLRDANGHVVGVVEIALDITEKRKMEEELLKIQRLESIATVAGGIAHDFNNLVTGIAGNISLARTYIDPVRVSERLMEVDKALLRAKNLAQRLLIFSRNGTPTRKTASIAELLEDSDAFFTLSRSSVRCEFSVPDDLWLAEINEGQISEVISNLVVNADEAMPEGGIIKVCAENMIVKAEDALPLQPGPFVKISIQDQGVGIPKEHLQKIFDLYFTTKRKGSGLGLATVYSIIKNHDGYITAESQVGVGTTFYVYLPASPGKILVEEEKEEEKPVM
jgi:two-component system cell cycle sensor histidine kinase/response regulator CckA